MAVPPAPAGDNDQPHRSPKKPKHNEDVVDEDVPEEMDMHGLDDTALVNPESGDTT